MHVQRENGGLLLALERGFYFYDLDSNDLTPLGDPEAGIATNRFNDGKCDPAGRFWAGTMALDKAPGNANLYRLNRDHNIEHVLSGVTTSNGLAWDRERALMYYIDTKTKKVQAYDYDDGSGAIANPRTAVTIADGAGSPDGMTIDQEGMLWIALFRGWRVIRVNPATGERLAEIAVPASQVTSCTFGGSSLDELYITTARTGLSEEALKEQPHAGGIFRVQPGVSGMPSYTFYG
ncbi:SMP-30/gluconolactonase/LRE family protein [Salisediminibacterium halotolerans]|nr:SMP-30/gluconolactonase/LRE family protein [Salisediminibacterium haloalkalitolerans]